MNVFCTFDVRYLSRTFFYLFAPFRDALKNLIRDSFRLNVEIFDQYPVNIPNAYLGNCKYSWFEFL